MFLRYWIEYAAFIILICFAIPIIGFILVLLAGIWGFVWEFICDHKWIFIGLILIIGGISLLARVVFGV